MLPVIESVGDKYETLDAESYHLKSKKIESNAPLMARVRQSTQLPKIKTLIFDGSTLANSNESVLQQERQLVSRLSSEKQSRSYSRVSIKSDQKSTPKVGTVLI